jgi:hypothetical protein
MMGFLLVIAATALPWIRFGDTFGAWSTAFRWSLLTPVAAVLGLGLAAWAWFVRRPVSSGGRLVLAGLALLAAAGAVLHVLRPPSIARPWVGPWAAMALALATLAATIIVLGRERAEPAPE